MVMTVTMHPSIRHRVSDGHAFLTLGKACIMTGIVRDGKQTIKQPSIRKEGVGTRDTGLTVLVQDAGSEPAMKTWDRPLIQPLIQSSVRYWKKMLMRYMSQGEKE